MSTHPTPRLGNLSRMDAEPVGAFLDEGELSIPRVLQTLRAAPPPGMSEDTPWGHKGHAIDLGYLKAVLQTLG